MKSHASHGPMETVIALQRSPVPSKQCPQQLPLAKFEENQGLPQIRVSGNIALGKIPSPNTFIKSDLSYSYIAYVKCTSAV